MPSALSLPFLPGFGGRRFFLFCGGWLSFDFALNTPSSIHMHQANSLHSAVATHIGIISMLDCHAVVDCKCNQRQQPTELPAHTLSLLASTCCFVFGVVVVSAAHEEKRELVFPAKVAPVPTLLLSHSYLLACLLARIHPPTHLLLTTHLPTTCTHARTIDRPPAATGQ